MTYPDFWQIQIRFTLMLLLLMILVITTAYQAGLTTEIIFENPMMMAGNSTGTNVGDWLIRLVTDFTYLRQSTLFWG